VTEQEMALTPKQAGKYVGVGKDTLRLWRSRGEGPRHFRAGKKLIRYRRTDLDAWIEARMSTSAPSAPTLATLVESSGSAMRSE
jgi:excisionase family DNA binding protein